MPHVIAFYCLKCINSVRYIYIVINLYILFISNFNELILIKLKVNSIVETRSNVMITLFTSLKNTCRTDK